MWQSQGKVIQVAPGASEGMIVGGSGAVATKAGMEPGSLVIPDQKGPRTMEEITSGI